MKRHLWSVLIALGAVCGSLAAFAGPVNINTADAVTLAAELTGVGPAIAEEIVRDRERNGRFENPEALMRVRGIGERVLEMNLENIRVESTTAN
jgi:competence protein ComEA